MDFTKDVRERIESEMRHYFIDSPTLNHEVLSNIKTKLKDIIDIQSLLAEYFRSTERLLNRDKMSQDQMDIVLGGIYEELLTLRGRLITLEREADSSQ